MGAGKSGMRNKSDSRNWVEASAGGKIDGYDIVNPSDRPTAINGMMGDEPGGAAETWYQDLSDAERDAVDFYSRKGYEAMNETLRQNAEPDPFYKARAEAAIPEMQKALSKYDLPQDTVLHRIDDGSLIGGAKTLTDVKAMVGKEVTDPGFTSATAQLTRGLERELTMGQDAGMVRYHIKTPAGKGSGAYLGRATGNTMSEREYIYNSGSKFKVLGGYTRTRDAGQPWAQTELHVNLQYVGRKK